MNKKDIILVIAAHPDDEILGCGGTIARHAEEGAEVHVRIMAEGLTSRDQKRNRDKLSKELSELAIIAEKANRHLGVTSFKLFDLPDNRMDSLDLLDIVKIIEDELSIVKPNLIYTHHAWDLNIDHRLVQQAIVTAARPIPGQTLKTLLFFEVASSTEWQPPGSGIPFQPNWFVDLSRKGSRGKTFFELKKEALEIYSSEMREWPHARSIKAVEHLASWRGASVGVETAESFMLGRNLL
ncbi:LmbE family protein [Leptospira kobayashii]|uniref:LmbE family protein n=1 Tax=Leptospira kobayashii TaxID=1917830 RepID=A0ABM7UJY4_9LEPT|nr:PIG-L family deacetylase [Leptospira kobayashii]BDA79198.1 LmbE family protein [Leptospira kobayashii]